jgi:alpha-tubulin suppressor-like RCC1 family protein
MVLTRANEVYAWGRNDSSQLGLGFISQDVMEPTNIRDVSQRHPTFVACGDDYSAVVCMGGEIFVTGCKEGGKLGLGPSSTQGILLNFTPIPKLNGIIFVSCGPNHMLAI